MATDQKIENLLNLALDADETEREKSLELDVGYDRQDRSWDLIVKYSGTIRNLEREGIRIVELANGYAIVTIRESLIPDFAALPEIEYIEKPKRLFFSVIQGRTASCIDSLQLDIPIPGVGEPLYGTGILVSVIDSGVDYTHQDFRNPDGSSRILAIWDQTVSGNSPKGYLLGTEYTKEEIDRALTSGNPLPTKDISGHGTEVLGIAAGNGRASLPVSGRSAAIGPNHGVAPLADILVVKLGNPKPDSFPKTTELMQAIDYVYKKAEEYGLPVAVNLSFGNVYGSHDGSGLLETYLTDMADQWRSVIVVGTGNEGNTAGHSSGNLQMGVTENIEMGIAAGERTVNVQLWKSYADEFSIFLVHPDGQVLGPLQENLGPQRFLTGGTEILIYYGEPSPFSVSQEIYFDFLPRDTFVDSGIWKFRLVPRKITGGRYDLWLPSAAALNPGTRFYRPDVENTMTIPSTSRKITAVGAYDSRSLTYAPFSGRGDAGRTGLVKPDLAAPGVNIKTTAVGGGYTTVSGTSFAAPFVTGASALLMEWGLIRKNDPYLYGEKVRAYLIRGAKRLPGYEVWPNNYLGYGRLCVSESLPR